MDTAQILLLVVVGLLTALLLFLGVQIFLILKEFRKTVGKINKVLDDTGVISESIAAPVANLTSVMAGVKTGISLLSMFKKKKKFKKMFEEDEEAEVSGEPS